MSDNIIISPTGANHLYWLGRYEERVYATLHLLRKCYDKMIDCEPAAYEEFWRRFNVGNTYSTVKEFERGMLYDESNPSSVISAQRRALDNAMVLRHCIMSESLGYLEMSMATLQRCKESHKVNITDLQPVTDWSLAFFSCVEQRVDDRLLLGILKAGRLVEYLDTLLRFDYPDSRVRHNFESLQQILLTVPGIVDEKVLKKASALIETEDISEAPLRMEILGLVNRIVKV